MLHALWVNADAPTPNSTQGSFATDTPGIVTHRSGELSGDTTNARDPLSKYRAYPDEFMSNP
ncbi:hypothetical protein Pst134EA_007673 [Puccinia striiformis f. sp. tritici]|uniref:Uncharacterized protein n=1 Tax=Puccinia striiformis TaxID=27350 RepID=A0A2S4VMS9_9BASI|nr:hypothetical protein Pst134EA_007673 [Puccinia striiformis f. sp. tritici]KAH9470415.1 hypothetical protein Pst134EA_007673 [Puccinia striiformis f. sp. tritici]POW10847.1 hypothetical protein PSTT_05814 [Puccinia striiformis]